MSRHSTVITISGTIVRETGKAICFTIEKISGEEVELETPTQWIPFSQVEKIMKNPHGPDELVVSEWILKQKELI